MTMTTHRRAVALARSMREQARSRLYDAQQTLAHAQQTHTRALEALRVAEAALAEVEADDEGIGEISRAKASAEDR